ncbi:hypothetical protein EIB18_17180 [Caulobacter vibrioides]|uniref:Uncharacterized protein n=2 Tax=Caulobacter vibrioides TaxID=155892 RepID=Q9A3G3_CAUVC|nr:hypothetical protein [Caulobacter vibrioides]YP_002518722.1 hypothetical protein CCNA_03350 [Caulobacter vibrioides NA1000]AAK25203.1 hypothetical protein CC_3241 [Caulobacter vibrioides CB15]ACL96814.1 hypothetical protein CCNA_03350 [Caulobacter vibrioides NA1000]ATC26124.1 hypothetical protein CA608_17085 [Caulobacter vibrioides]ATC30068.1 hypothetical protein CA607_17435 [Caulobacter vibrioides]AZH14264.1 hypothetical protein EIB18_17180 [Caulobacter vibrioides]
MTMVFQADSHEVSAGEIRVFRASRTSGGLDDASDLKVRADMYISSALPRHRLHEDVLLFEQNPPD